MSSKSIFLFLVIGFELCPSYIDAQDQPFHKIVPPKDSPYSLITGITQDTSGYMWFTSDHVLYRFDGYKFISYTHDALDNNSLSKSILTTVFGDRAGCIWIGTAGGGLDKYDPKKGRFINYRNNKKDSFSIINDTVICILEDRQGNIWTGTKAGLSRLNKITGKFTSYVNDPGDSSTLSNNHIRTIYEDHYGTIWIGTGSPFINDSMDSDEGGLNRFEAESGKFIRYLRNPLDKYSLGDNRVQSIYEDSRGIFWVGTAGDGLHTLNRDNGKFTRHVYDPTAPTKLSRPPLRKTGTCSATDYISFIKEDITGNIWIGTLAGVNRYNPRTNSVSLISSFGRDSLNDVSAKIMYTSMDGVVWLGTWSENLYTIDPLTKPISHMDLNSGVWCFHEDDNGNIWIGTNDGVIVMDSNKKILNRFGNDFLGIPYSDNSFVVDINQDSKGVIWISTTDGLARYNNANKTFTLFKNNPKDSTSISKGAVFSVHKDKKGIFWVCTSGGLDEMNVLEGTFKHLRHDPNDSNSIANNSVNGIFEDSEGKLWITNWNGGGLNLLNRSRGNFKHYLSGLSISSIYQDTDHVIWIGTESDGLFKYNTITDNFSRYVDPGTFITNHIIVGIIEDKFKNLWVASLSGIVCLNRERTETIRYGTNKGVEIKALRYGAIYRLKNGELLFGDANGFYSFFPEKMQINRISPKLAISEIKYFNRFHDPVEDSIINLSLQKFQEVQLDHDQNSFSIDFAALHYSSPYDNQHFFMLENYDTKWRKPTTELKAEYFNMTPGTYVFRMKVASSDGIWVSRKIKIYISPAWWNTWWFRLSVLVTIFNMFYLIIRGRMNARFRAKINQSEREKELAQLRHKTTELEMYALRSQMNPHFIFNSLNSINTFILENNKDQASAYLTMFSKLMRLILQNSQAELITLECELEALKLYLELESVRFDNHFSFNIKLDGDLDPENLKVPPLIIQPYAENAIWHGLMHKKDKGFLLIELLEEENYLVCRIIDDGIGRKRAAALQSKSASRHKSMGMKITADRIAIMQSQNSNQSNIKIKDLTFPDGQPAGTCVELNIPVYYD